MHIIILYNNMYTEATPLIHHKQLETHTEKRGRFLWKSLLSNTWRQGGNSLSTRSRANIKGGVPIHSRAGARAILFH